MSPSLDVTSSCAISKIKKDVSFHIMPSTYVTKFAPFKVIVDDLQPQAPKDQVTDPSMGSTQSLCCSRSEQRSRRICIGELLFACWPGSPFALRAPQKRQYVASLKLKMFILPTDNSWTVECASQLSTVFCYRNILPLPKCEDVEKAAHGS